MKILSSSPYATFNVKEWNSATGPFSAVNSKSLKLKKIYSQRSDKNIYRVSIKGDYKDTDIVQLSFA